MNDDDKPDSPSHVREHSGNGTLLGTDSKPLGTRELILAIQKMNPGQKRLLAAKGNAAVRKILLRDPNHEVQMAIVTSPKTTEGEIEQLASLASTAEVVIKAIANDGRWMKSYRIKRCLAVHPKAPMVLSTRCLRGLTAHDLKKIALDVNVKKSVAQAAQQMMRTRK